jgi:hypothetical protein
MKSLKLSLVTLALALIGGCASAPNEGRLQEPLRTMNTISCLRANLTVTTCMCVEKEMFHRFGTEDKAISKGFKNKTILSEVLTECVRQNMPEVEGKDM